MPARQKNHLSPTRSQRGAVLMLLLLLFAVGALAVFVTGLNRATVQLDRDRITSEALAQAKEALIGDAAAVSEVTDAGHLQLPDLGFGPIHPTVLSEGYAAPNFAGNFKDYSVIGKIPWRSLGIAPLQDGQGECLWYVVSGRFKKTPPTGDVFNWDTPGQIDVIDGNGSPIANNIAALVVSPGRGVDQQERKQSDPAYTQCGGNYDARNYLDSYNVSDAVSGVVNYFSGSTNSRVAPDANNKQFVMAANNHYNDRFLFITVDDIFRPIIRRSDFATQIQDLLNDTYFWTTNITLTGDKGTDDILCSSLSPSNRPFCINWKEMLLLTNLPSPSPITIDGSPTSEVCDRVLIFGGQKKATQVRLTADDKDKPVNYLEAPNLDAFAAHDGSFSGASGFKSTNPSADILRCIKLAGSVQTSFAADFGKFVATGTLVSDDDGVQVYGTGVTVNTINKTLAIGGAGGTAGGCFWYPDAIPLAGKTLRAYYDYQFSTADTFALTGTGSDRGNGFTFQLARSDFVSPPTVCGLETNMGALAMGDPATDIWGSGSFIIETDVHKDATKSDPVENHTAIMYGGDLNHSLTNGNPTTACNGSAAGCRHNPANKFEESPSPLPHNQRIEIQTGCDSSCSNCIPANHSSPNTYAKISTWVDCKHCDDVAAALFDPESEFIMAPEDRDFSVPGLWTGTHWQVAGGVLSHALAGADAVSLPNAALFGPPVAGATYQVTITVATTTPGKLVITFGGTSAAAIDLVTGTPMTYTVQLAAASPGALTLTPDAAWVGTIDNASVARLRPYLPTIQRCVDLDAYHDARMNSVYFGFTGGFRSSVNTSQGVTFKNFYLRSE